MFQWLFPPKKTSGSLPALCDQFLQMLTAAQQEMMLGSGAFLHQLEASEVQEEIFALDKQINKAERTLRQELFICAVVHGESVLATCFTLMSLVKDAERLGDFAKNFYDLAILTAPLPAKINEQMTKIQKEILTGISECQETFKNQDSTEARELIFRFAKLNEELEAWEMEILRKGEGTQASDAVCVLALHYFQRCAAHLKNITSAVVQPLSKIDFTGKIVRDIKSHENIAESAG